LPKGSGGREKKSKPAAARNAFQCFCILVVWSYCEELQESFNDNVLSDLFNGCEAQKAEAKKARIEANQIPDVIVFAGGGPRETSNPFADFPASYGSVLTAGVGGSTHIFGGAYHETSFPPGRWS